MKPTDSQPPGALLGTQRPDTGGPKGTPLALPVERMPFDKRFEDLVEIGKGGMSVVRRMWDRVLERSVAMKLLPAGTDADAAVDEARIAAGLQHPGVVPVYEVGRFDDGRVWLEMPEITGLDLHDALDRAVADDPAWPRQRLLELFRRLCETMAFVHDRGVVHRDLKPGNIRLGDFGEVVVLDWGIAGPAGKRRGRSGTAGYAPPEQTDGAPLDPRMDVYALGRILERILERLPGGADDARLRRLAERATRIRPDMRPATAQVLADELAGWLDSARRRTEGRRLVTEALRLKAEIEALGREADALEAEAAALLDGVEDHAPTEEKLPAWRRQDEARALRRRVRSGRLEYERQLQEARRRSEDLPEARHALADYYKERVVEAERAHEPEVAEEYEARLRELDDGTHAEFLSGVGALTVVTDPPGAEVWCAPYVLRDRRLVPGEERLLGHTPLRGVPLARGSWRLRLTHPGYTETLYPVQIDRGEAWHGVPPGETEARPIRLPRLGELGDDERYVPAGWFQAGGDPLAMDGLSRRWVWLDGFVMRRDPLTYRDLVGDLHALWRTEQRGRAADIAARLTEGRKLPFLRIERDADGFHVVPERSDVDVLDWPVVQMDWFAACAWTRWRAERANRPWRLPHDLEREKATRGVDGRLRPWGDFMDPTWANVHGSRPGEPRLTAVDACPTDVSPYGIRGLMGNVRDWCLNGYRKHIPPTEHGPPSLAPAPADAQHRMVRGGGWASSPSICRAASRFASPPKTAAFQVGVRLVRAWPA